MKIEKTTYVKADEKQIVKNIAYLIYDNQKKMEQLQRVSDICYHLTSDTGISITIEMYPGTLVRYLITGTRCSMTITGDPITREITRKPRNVVPTYTATVTTYCDDILKAAEKMKAEDEKIAQWEREQERQEPEPMNRKTWKMYAHLTRLAFYLYCDQKVTGSKDMERAQKTATTIFHEYYECIPERETDFKRWNNAMYTMLDYLYHAREKREK